LATCWKLVVEIWQFEVFRIFAFSGMMAVFPRKFCVSKAHFSGQESVKICPEMRH
jgi:hypothetical protein